MKAERGLCCRCRYPFALRRDGTLRRHAVYPGGPVCPGSGLPPPELAKVIPFVRRRRVV